MTNKLFSAIESPKVKNTIYIFTALVLLLTIILSFVSFLNVCTETCVESHNYRIFGFTFETIGLLFFSFLFVSHLLSYYYHQFKVFTGWLLCAGIGAELMFIYAQRAIIGAWCPLCLSIATALFLAGIAYFIPYYADVKNALKQQNKGRIMNAVYSGIKGIVFFAVGFIFAFAGFGKENQLQAAESAVNEKMIFGDGNKDVVVYIFTDWRCPACRALESTFESMTPHILAKADLMFIDDPVHVETMNYSPYNLSFMVHNKDKYFSLRHALNDLSVNTKAPTEEQIEALASSLGVKYIPLNYSEVALASEESEKLVKKYNVEGTPTIIVVNKMTDKNQKLAGFSEISEEKVLKSIEFLTKK